MPIYSFKHPEKEEFIEVYQKMDEEHVYFDKDGLEWKRVFSIPNIGSNTKTDPFSQNDFIKNTDKKGITLGEMWDASAEASEKRAEKEGKDPLKTKAQEEYRKKYPNKALPPKLRD